MDKYSVKSVGALIKKKQNSYIMCIDLVRLLLGDEEYVVISRFKC